MHDWIVSLIDRAGYAGVALLMVAENVFPPIPSELVMPLAGFTAARESLNLLLVVLAGTAGSVIGTFPWYFAGRWMGGSRLNRWAEHHGRWLTLTPADLEKAQAWFERHCGKAVLLGRLIPTVRTLISVPAGITRMALGRFLLLSAIGSLIWAGALAFAGHRLGQDYGKVAEYLGPVSNAVLGLVLATYLVRVVRWKPEHRTA
jgi:membrane protein DedA with SNARE-associated domain